MVAETVLLGATIVIPEVSKFTVRIGKILLSDGDGQAGYVLVLAVAEDNLGSKTDLCAFSSRKERKIVIAATIDGNCLA